jgi:hypothetical protein
MSLEAAMPRVDLNRKDLLIFIGLLQAPTQNAAAFAMTRINFI